MIPTVYWFSGTGNSLTVARDIAFPAHYMPFGGLPQMLKRFVGKLQGLRNVRQGMPGRERLHGAKETGLACYNWCPNQAITAGALKTERRYRHPEVKATDLMVRLEQ